MVKPKVTHLEVGSSDSDERYKRRFYVIVFDIVIIRFGMFETNVTAHRSIIGRPDLKEAATERTTLVQGSHIRGMLRVEVDVCLALAWNSSEVVSVTRLCDSADQRARASSLPNEWTVPAISH